MPHSADKSTRSIVGRALLTASTIAAELRASIRRYFRRFGLFRGLNAARDTITATVGTLRDHFHYTKMASWIGGFDWAWKQVPDGFKPLVETVNRPPIFIPPVTQRPPQDPLPPLFSNAMFDAPPEVRFPKIESAARRLLERGAMTRDEFDAATDAARDDAFTVAGDIERDVIETIRDTLAKNLQQGTSLTGFTKALDERLITSFAGDAHLETVYRTNVQGAFRDGRETLMANPVVADLFPYQEYVHISDSRVRDEHAQLSQLGLDGTGVYRRDDKFWTVWTPPIDYNCRCTAVPLTIEKAAAKGVKEAQRWLRTGEPPAQPEWRFAAIPFAPKPGWGSRGRVGAVAL